MIALVFVRLKSSVDNPYLPYSPHLTSNTLTSSSSQVSNRDGMGLWGKGEDRSFFNKALHNSNALDNKCRIKVIIYVDDKKPN